MAKILITGASGFVGSFLVKEALNRGLEVYAGIRNSSSKEFLQDERIKFFEIDFGDNHRLIQDIRNANFDYIIQNAGITRAQQESQYFTVNVDYAVNLAMAALYQNSPLKKYTYISSIEAYGAADGTPNEVVEEGIKPAPRTVYGKSKIRAERALKSIDDLPLIILRPTAVFGPAERDIFTIFKTLKRFKIAPVVGNNNIKYSFVYVKDLARVVLDATLSDITNRSYFVSDGRIHTMRSFIDAIARAYNVTPLRFTIPYRVIDSICGINQVLDRMTGRKSLVNPENVAKMKAQNWDVDIAPLVQDFNYSPHYSLEEAVTETAQWYVDQKWV